MCNYDPSVFQEECHLLTAAGQSVSHINSPNWSLRRKKSEWHSLQRAPSISEEKGYAAYGPQTSFWRRMDHFHASFSHLEFYLCDKWLRFWVKHSSTRDLFELIAVDQMSIWYFSQDSLQGLKGWTSDLLKALRNRNVHKRSVMKSTGLSQDILINLPIPEIRQFWIILR